MIYNVLQSTLSAHYTAQHCTLYSVQTIRNVNVLLRLEFLCLFQNSRLTVSVLCRRLVIHLPQTSHKPCLPILHISKSCLLQTDHFNQMPSIVLLDNSNGIIYNTSLILVTGSIQIQTGDNFTTSVLFHRDR